MENHDSQHEFHDELLSAYLDGELSGEERARVEERLAVDPVARQTLADLRSVSQAMRGLPRERVGEDLRSVILARVQDVKPGNVPSSVTTASAGLEANGQGEPSTSDENDIEATHSRPTFSIGRTRRGWAWAALAVAAAIVVMFVQRGEERGRGNLQVAADDAGRQVDKGDQSAERESADGPDAAFRGKDAALVVEDGRRLDRDSAPLELRPLNESASRVTTAPVAPTDGLSALSPPSGKEERYAESVDNQPSRQKSAELTVGTQLAQESSAVPRDETAAVQDLAAASREVAASSRGGDVKQPEAAPPVVEDAERRTQSVEAVAQAGVQADTAEAELSQRRPAAPVAESLRDVMIVYVDVNQDAMQSGDFGRKLAANQIAIDPTPMRFSKQFASPDEAKLTDDGPPADGVDALASEVRSRAASALERSPVDEAILVEAPPAQIERLLGQLSADAENVVGISISESGAIEEMSRIGGSATLNWQRFNRSAAAAPQPNLAEQKAEVLNESANQGAAPAVATGGLAFDAASANQRRGGRGGRGAARGGFGGGGGGRGGAAADPSRGGGGGGGRGRGRGAVAGPASVEGGAPSDGTLQGFSAQGAAGFGTSADAPGPTSGRARRLLLMEQPAAGPERPTAEVNAAARPQLSGSAASADRRGQAGRSESGGQAQVSAFGAENQDSARALKNESSAGATSTTTTAGRAEKLDQSGALAGKEASPDSVQVLFIVRAATSPGATNATAPTSPPPADGAQ
jgi:hypothetical protein